MLMFARLMYGSSHVPVIPNDSAPIPAAFDFNDIEGCSRKIFAIMSMASGGYPVERCQLRIDPVRMTANLTGNGVHVFYGALKGPAKMTVAEAIEATERTQLFHLGDVRSPAHHEGWKRAVWTPHGAV